MACFYCGVLFGTGKGDGSDEKGMKSRKREATETGCGLDSEESYHGKDRRNQSVWLSESDA